MGSGFCRRKFASGIELSPAVPMSGFDGSNFEMNRSKLEPFASNLETIISIIERWNIMVLLRTEPSCIST